MASITLRRKSVEYLELVTGGNDIRSKDKKKPQLLENYYSNSKLALKLVPDPNDSLLKELIRNHTKQVLYSGQIAYNSKPISKTKKTAPEISQSSLANFVSSRTAKSNKHMI